MDKADVVYTHTHTHTHTHIHNRILLSHKEKTEIAPFVTTRMEVEGIMLGAI